MRGYKGFNKDLKCRGMQYEVGKTNHQDGEIITCKNGLHFCTNMTNVFNYYDIDEGSRYCEVEAFGEIDFSRDDKKFAAGYIRVIRELSKVEINRCWYGNGCGGAMDYGDGFGYGQGNGNGFGFGDGYYGGGDGARYGYYQEGNGYRTESILGDGTGYGYVDNIADILTFEEV